jgi:hypothetical protein
LTEARRIRVSEVRRLLGKPLVIGREEPPAMYPSSFMHQHSCALGLAVAVMAITGSKCGYRGSSGNHIGNLIHAMHCSGESSLTPVAHLMHDGQTWTNPIRGKARAMEVLYARSCGLDVHKSSITACVLIGQSGKPLKHIRRFGCTTRELRELVVAGVWR